MRVERSGDVIWIYAELRQSELVKQIPGARWNKEHRLWWCPLTWAACVTLRGVFGPILEIGSELAEWAVSERKRRVDPCLELRDQEDFDLNGLPLADGLALEPRQRAGVAFLATAGRALLGDGMGSGKTVQTIMALETLSHLSQNPYPALVVAPNSVKRTWAREFAVWAPNRRIAVVEGNITKRRKTLAQLAAGELDVVIMHWEQLRSHSRCQAFPGHELSAKEATEGELNHIPLRTFIGDEAHRAKNPQAQQTRAAWRIAWACEFRFALTGTPVANSPEDLWSIMHLVEPREWPTKGQFINRYALTSWSVLGFSQVVGIKGETRDEFFKILDPRFIRRPTRIVVPDLIPKLPPQIRSVPLEGKQKTAYEDMRKSMLAELDGGVLMAGGALAKLTRLMQLAAAYGVLDDEGNLQLTEPSVKVDALVDILDELGEEQAVVFAESKQLINLASKRLEKLGIAHGLITGDIGPAHRQKAVDEFQSGMTRAVLATLGAGGEGLTLTASRHPVFLQRSFSLIKNAQAEDRVWRKGQDREVQPIYVVTDGTVEERVLEVGETKAERLEEVCRDEASLREILS